VPGLYRWRVVEREGEIREVSVYLQPVQGPTLEQRWATMSITEKRSIASELCAMTSYFRSLRDQKFEQVIGGLAVLMGTSCIAQYHQVRYATVVPRIAA
jgi:hypothetical protein